MEAQQGKSPMLDFAHLDRLLNQLPSPSFAAFLRHQFVDGCRVVEQGQEAVATLRGELEGMKNDLQCQLDQVVEKERALTEEQAKLQDFAVNVLPSQMKDLTGEIDKISSKVISSSNDVLGKLGAASETSDQFEDKVSDFCRELSDTTTSIDNRASEISDSVGEINDEIANGLVPSLLSIVEIMTANKKLTAALPTQEYMTSELDKVANMRQQATEFKEAVERLVGVNEDLRNDAVVLEAEAAVRIRAAESSRDSALSKLADEKARVVRRDSRIMHLEEDLEESQESAQQAGVYRQELSKVKAELEQSGTSSEELKATVAELRRQLAHEMEQNGKCSERLSEVQERLEQRDSMCHELQEARSNLQHELSELRSKEALDLRKKFEDHLTSVNISLERQVSDQRSHDQSVRNLTDSWNNERRALTGQISAKDSTIELQSGYIKTLKSQVSALEPLRGQLQEANRNLEEVQWSATQSSSALRSKQDELVECERRAEQFEQSCMTANAEVERLRAQVQEASRNLEEVQRSATQSSSALRSKQDELVECERRVEQFEQSCITANAEVERLRGEASAVKGRADNATRLVADLEQKLDAVNTELTILKDHQCVVIPDNVTGDLAKTYLRLAEEFRDIPTHPEVIGELDKGEIAAELAILVDGWNAKENLAAFVCEQSPDWHCIRQVLFGAPQSPVTEGVCHYHDNKCLLARVVVSESPMIQFFKAL
ncbi:hypothetical protein FNAPI_9697 [Fusarium napiforme]|uniref:Uncharacterized protein n=1 Tax=Fusarium napiforme TaxID=42672 RepID=A0A8H5ITZ0_9HYPO|nr:hypothetical protein FNAPI_9697 [Fusarium napiforme]